MSELINGELALQDIHNSEISYNANIWFPLTNCEFKIQELLVGMSDRGHKLYFRTKPKTITLNGTEIPAPFVPKSDQEYWILFESYHSGDGYKLVMEDDQYHNLCFGAWRTEDQIKQVVAALRNVFGGNIN